MTPRLILFDVDGTLVDSQAHIIAAMSTAFAACEMPPPARAEILSIVGLSLPQAMARLAPQAGPDDLARLVEAYKDSFSSSRRAAGLEGAPPLFPGMMDLLDTLAAMPEAVLGVATGKSRRGLDHLFEAHALAPLFLTVQVADDHPSKPHPSMVRTAMAETGIEAAATVMIGDTSFDMEMARSAGVAALGVGWGYHPGAALTQAGALSVADDAEALRLALETAGKAPA